MRGKKKIELCAALTAGILSLAGCGNAGMVVNNQDTVGEVTTITFFGNKYEPENVMVIEEILSDFMKENQDIRVSYESLKGTEYYDALAKRMAAGKGDDVFMVNHDILLELMENGQVADLSGLSAISDFTDQMIGQMKKDDGKIYWVPTTVSAFGLYCNKDILLDHGLKVPENLEEWEQSCGYFAEKGITPLIANNDISLKTLAIGRGFFGVYQEGRQEEVFDRLNRGEEKLSDYLKDGFSIAGSFIDKGYIDAGKALVTKKTSDDLEEFAKGETPFMLTGAWAAGRVRKMNPDLSFEVVPYPVLKDGALLVVNADTRLSVNADSDNRDAALRFVEYFIQEDNIRKFAGDQASFSPLKSGGDSSLEEIQPLLSCYRSGKTVIGTDSLLSLPIWELTEEVSKRLLSGETLDVTMQRMDLEAAQEGGTF